MSSYLSLTILVILGLASPVVILSNDIVGEIEAFVDVNYDRFTDLIVKRRGNLVVYKSVTYEKDLKFVENVDFLEDADYTQDFSRLGEVENVAVGDFNGDSFPDLLVTTRFRDTKVGVNVSVCWGSMTSFTGCEMPKYTFREQPIIMNCDDDALSDFFAIELNHTRRCYLGQVTAHLFRFADMPSNNKTTVAGAAHAFVDITGDLNADLVLQVEPDFEPTSGKQLPQFEVWSRAGTGVEWSLLPEDQIPPPPVYHLSSSSVNTTSTPPPLVLFGTDDRFTTGHVIFDDWNRDGWPDMLMPVCQGPKGAPCQNFRVLIWSGGDRAWFWIDVNNMRGTGGVLFPGLSGGNFGDLALTVRSGDYTQNGYPDLLVVLVEGDSKKDRTRGYFIENAPCLKEPGDMTPKPCAQYGRTFSLSYSPVTPCERVTAATFFDLKEDGMLDVLYNCVNDSQVHTVQFAPSTSNQDSTFLKIEAYTPTCSSTCANSKEGTGISLPGAAFKYAMTDTDGNEINAAYTQQSRTSHRSLMLPYALFGLGRTPNFVDRLVLGVPQHPATTQTWPQIVPNSRIYVIPYPAKDSSHWVWRLYVTPNRLVVMSVAALGGVCALIGVTVLVLQCCEMQQDRKERDVLKKRFHFDAM